MKMEIIAKIQNRDGNIHTISVNKPKALAILLFTAKLGKYANKNHRIIYFFCDDPKFLTEISSNLPKECYVTMIKET